MAHTAQWDYKRICGETEGNWHPDLEDLCVADIPRRNGLPTIATARRPERTPPDSHACRLRMVLSRSMQSRNLRLLKPRNCHHAGSLDVLKHTSDQHIPEAGRTGRSCRRSYTDEVQLRSPSLRHTADRVFAGGNQFIAVPASDRAV